MRKGIILAGGSGTRLYPATDCMNAAAYDQQTLSVMASARPRAPLVPNWTPQSAISLDMEICKVIA